MQAGFKSFMAFLGPLVAIPCLSLHELHNWNTLYPQTFVLFNIQLWRQKELDSRFRQLIYIQYGNFHNTLQYSWRGPAPAAASNPRCAAVLQVAGVCRGAGRGRGTHRNMPEENYCKDWRKVSLFVKETASGAVQWSRGWWWCLIRTRDEHEQLMGELACQTPCRELLIPLRGQVRGTRVDWTLLSFSSASADEDTNQLVLIVVHLQRTRKKTRRRMLC